MLGSTFILAGVLTGVDPALLSAVCWVESNHQPAAYAESDGGSPSLGLCQIKLGTARWLGFEGEASDLMEPNTNAYYAAKYLRRQYLRYGTWERAVSAYNCGYVCNNTSYVNRVFSRRGQ